MRPSPLIPVTASSRMILANRRASSSVQTTSSLETASYFSWYLRNNRRCSSSAMPPMASTRMTVMSRAPAFSKEAMTGSSLSGRRYALTSFIVVDSYPSSLHLDHAANHPHPARVLEVAALLGRERERHRLLERQLRPDILARDHDLLRARRVRLARDDELQRFALRHLHAIGLESLLRYLEIDGLWRSAVNRERSGQREHEGDGMEPGVLHDVLPCI